MPPAVMVASPGMVRPAKASVMRFSGVPSNRLRKCSDQAVVKPQFAGRSGATRPGGNARTQAPSEPSRGQDAPPSASTTGPAAAAGGSNTGAPAASQPSQRCRGWKRTPAAARRASQARSSGDAFIATGNTRPLLPVKVGCPSAAHQSRRAAGGKAAMAGARAARAGP